MGSRTSVLMLRCAGVVINNPTTPASAALCSLVRWGASPTHHQPCIHTTHVHPCQATASLSHSTYKASSGPLDSAALANPWQHDLAAPPIARHLGGFNRSQQPEAQYGRWQQESPREHCMHPGSAIGCRPQSLEMQSEARSHWTEQRQAGSQTLLHSTSCSDNHAHSIGINLQPELFLQTIPHLASRPHQHMRTTRAFTSVTRTMLSQPTCSLPRMWGACGWHDGIAAGPGILSGFGGLPDRRTLSTLRPGEQLTQQGSMDVCASLLAASVNEDMANGGGGTQQAPAPALLSVLRSSAMAMQWVHDTTGLPWWASIPLTTLAVRTMLLPFSMWQARTVRTNYQVYREAVDLTDKQLGTSQEGTSSSTSADDKASQLRRGRLLLSNFALLRTKLSAPHPAWILINPLVQLPVFVMLGGGLRLMAGVHWPGLSTGGALWFNDLTQVAVSPGSHLFSSSQDQAWALPLGPEGVILPLAMLAMTLASLRLGFGAAGTGLAPPPQDTIGRVMRALPYVLGCLAVANTCVALQLPHAPLLHWIASSSFTLSLQVALQQPGFRSAFNLPSPSELQAALRRTVNQRLQQLSEVGGTLGPGRGYALSSLPDKLIKQVSSERSADVLVVLGAQHSAGRRYREALYCLDRALQLEPAHVRAHYSRGQVFSLNNRWTDAEACFRRATELAVTPAERGQALYCIATALHTQGKLEGAVSMYREALPVWSQQAVVTFSLANALMELGRAHEAKAAVEAVLGDGQGQRAGPFLQPLKALAAQIDNATQQQAEARDSRDK